MSQDCPQMSLFGYQVTLACRGITGLSWDVPVGILWTLSHLSLPGCAKTVLGCPSWDPPDIKSPQLARMSKDSTGMSHMGSSGHQVTPACKDVPGQSWDVPHGILRTSNHPSSGVARLGHTGARALATRGRTPPVLV